MCTRNPLSGGAQGVDGPYNAWRSGAPGPHAHGNAARQVVDDRRAAEVRGQQKPSNDPHNNQHNRRTPTTGHRHCTNGTLPNQNSPGTPTTGLRERGNNTTRNTSHSSRQNAATQCSMRSEEQVTVQGPVKKQQPDEMSDRGALQTSKWLYGSMDFVDDGDFVPRISQGEFFSFYPMCLYSKYSEFCGKFTNE